MYEKATASETYQIVQDVRGAARFTQGPFYLSLGTIILSKIKMMYK